MGNQEILGQCPECGADVIETAKAFSCSKWKESGCKFSLWKDSLKRLGKETISGKEAIDLLAGKTIKLNKLKGKSGKEFSAGGKLEKDEKWGWQIKLAFEDRKEERE